MNDQSPSEPGGDSAAQWENMLRSVFGGDADSILEQMREHGFDPEQLSASTGLGDNPAALSAALNQIKNMLSSGEQTSVNAGIAHDVARQVASGEGGDPSITSQQRRDVAEAFDLANLWLDTATDFPATTGHVHAWSRSEWVEATIETWTALTEPVAHGVVSALVELLGKADGTDFGNVNGFELPSEFDLPGDQSAPTPDLVLRRVGSAVFGMQVGQATGTLSREVFGTTDVALPLLASNDYALVPLNVLAFGEGLDLPESEVRLFLALREAASARLFAHVPWLRSHLTDLVGAYAQGISINMETLEETIRDIDPTDTTALQEALSSGVFGVTSTPQQHATLRRLETALALVEGWVDDVVTVAASRRLPHVTQLREMIRRRRAAGGPAEQTFSTLVGLELRPKRAREASSLWELLRTELSASSRDQVWDHPDFLPTGDDLDSPAVFVAQRRSPTVLDLDVDEAIARLLGEPGESGAGKPDAGESDAGESGRSDA